MIKRGSIEAWVRRTIREMIESEEYEDELINYMKESRREERRSGDSLKLLRAEARGLDREIKRILDELLSTPSRSLRERLLDREAKLAAVNARIEAIEKAPRVKPIEGEIKKYLALIDRSAKTIETAGIEEQKRIVSYFVERGEVDRERREVRFYFFALPAAHMIRWPIDAASIGGGDAPYSEAAYKVMVYQIA